ncbi:flavodoxin [Muribaculum intestinale]|jgi:flavodoxin|uniref:flavodoxin n=1 Tax=Muribaculum intestinale TaxID=1796646 RepID=UPI0025B0BEFA|nr:flavodoxin [Muribaculum intestinale]
MKIKMLSMIMSMLSLTACASCTTTDDDPITENPVPDSTPGTETGKNGSVLVAYFSCIGTTEGIAEGIADITGASTFRIEAEEPYTAADLDYNSDCRANREQNNPKARPAIKSMPDGLDRYDVVFLGYPIWWGEAPRIISTFLESGDFKGKTIVPFCSSHSSGL